MLALRLAFVPGLIQFILFIGKVFLNIPSSWTIALSPLILIAALFVGVAAYGAFSVLISTVVYKIRGPRQREEQEEA